MGLAFGPGFFNHTQTEHMEETKPTQDKWEFYQDAKGEYRWRRKAANGEIVGASTEGYKNRADCVANAMRNGYEPEIPFL